MRNCISIWLAATAALSLIIWAGAGAQTEDEAGDAAGAPAASTVNNPQFPWPAQFLVDGQSFTVYPPELQRWEGDQLQARVAVSVQSEGDAKPLYGVADLTGHVQVDKVSQVATVDEIRIVNLNFPAAAQNAPHYLEILEPRLAAFHWQLPVERLNEELAVDRAARQSHSQPVRNELPVIVFSDRPAILVPIDGQPMLKEMVGLGLKRVLNTRALILQDRESDRYFIYVAGRWMESRKLEGPWAEAQVRPSALDEARQQAQSSGQADLLDADNRAGGPIRLIVSTTPTELVQTDGPPQYSPVAGTQLLYVTNTSSRLFLDLRTQQYYALLSGRWFRAGALDQGRWEYVAGSSLPPDFAAIPDSHPTATVRESVPGTPQASEAVIANSVPQVATVKRTEARLDVTYDGAPQFHPIEGTPLAYAVNAAIPVIRVDDRNYYALENGVWFFSATVTGPWSPASFVPAVIYTIPRSSPLHYVTYVRVYDASSDSVYVGYDPGYVGSYVTPDNTVVYGSGYYYRPWMGSVWYPCPITWGFGFTYWNSWWNPWPWWRPWWVYRPVPHFQPYWGPWGHWASWRRPIVAPRPVAPVPVAPVPPPSVVAPRPAAPVPPPSVAVSSTSSQVAHPTAGNVAGVTNIYHRWGANIAIPHSATAMQAGGETFRRHDGEWQRFNGSRRSESAPATSMTGQWQGNGTGAAVSAPAGQAPGFTAPRHDRRFPQDSGISTTGGPRSIVGPAPGIATPSNPAGNAMRSAPPTPRPIVGPPPSISPVPQPTTPAPNPPANGRSIVGPTPGIQQPVPDPADARHAHGDRGHSTAVVPNSNSTGLGVQRQGLEHHGAFPARPVPVPAPVAPRALPERPFDRGAGASVPRPTVLGVPHADNGRMRTENHGGAHQGRGGAAHNFQDGGGGRR